MESLPSPVSRYIAEPTWTVHTYHASSHKQPQVTTRSPQWQSSLSDARHTEIHPVLVGRAPPDLVSVGNCGAQLYQPRLGDAGHREEI